MAPRPTGRCSAASRSARSEWKDLNVDRLVVGGRDTGCVLVLMRVRQEGPTRTSDQVQVQVCHVFNIRPVSAVKGLSLLEQRGVM